VADHPSTIPSKDLWRTTMLYQQYNILKKMDNEIGWQFPHWLHIRIGNTANGLAERGMHDSVALNKLFAAVHEKTGKPKFVYTHLLIPHDHYALDSAGHRIPPKNNNTLAATKASYLLQLVNANKAIRKMVDSIQSANPTPPIIIIQGDHGFRSGDYRYRHDEFDNFNAVYFPEKWMMPAPDSLTSVNTFRYVFNHLFRTSYPMLENRKIFLKYKPL
jgi:phosphoglycerol transferase MdoB-like AlkP superfamily enzyme